MKKTKLIVILGPTASGKTDMAIQLAKKFKGEIISADSRQIYRGMDIGTAKIEGKHKVIENESCIEYEGINHYMIDIIDPDYADYSTSEFQKDTNRIIKKIVSSGKIPFLVGGTGMYIQAVIDNFNIPHVKPNFEFRKKIEERIDKESLEILVKELINKCPNLSKSVDMLNPRRVIRAFEICEFVGDVKRDKKKSEYDVLQLGMQIDRDLLYQRINKRVDWMMEQGLLEECKKLFDKYDSKLPSMSSIGYLQLGYYLSGEMDLKESIELIKRDSRRYAKRQMSWFGRDSRIHWINSKEKAKSLILDFLG